MEAGNISAIATAYQIATLTYPSFEVIELLKPLPFERVLELLLIMRQSPRPVKSPLNFLRRAIQENWSAETMPEKVNRHIEYVEENFYLKKGYTIDQAREIVQARKRGG
ncbi:hypothetical protein [Paenibacillus tuaregi]|uniref:hypothetical protein n=1 Tax=Paenibacillus tuaregi TaxID=1816681 RepID=UPI0008388523|nr:hypothetical protein [Paenibacillus tuaregi]